MVTDLAGAIISGKPFCCRPTELNEDELVLWASEEPQDLFLERLVHDRTFNKEALAKLLVTFRSQAAGHYRWPDFMKQLETAVNEHASQGKGKVVLLILDTFQDWSDLVDDDENKTGPIKRELRSIRLFMEATGAAVLLIHHSRKAEGGFISQMIRGASALEIGRAHV